MRIDASLWSVLFLCHFPDLVRARFVPRTSSITCSHVGKQQAAATIFPGFASNRHRKKPVDHKHSNSNTKDSCQNSVPPPPPPPETEPNQLKVPINNSTGSSRADKSDHPGKEFHKVINVVEERAKEKAAFGLAGHVTEEISKLSDKWLGKATKRRISMSSKATISGGERLSERTVSETKLWRRLTAKFRGSNKPSTKAAGRVLEHSGERMMERVGERALERSGERVVEQSGERATERVGERALERALERAGEHLAEQSSVKAGAIAVERAGERIMEQSGRKAAGKTVTKATERAGERIGERIGERVLDQTGKKLGERTVERAAEHVIEGTGERLAERGVAMSAERIGERAAEHAGEKVMGKASERAMEHAGEKLAAKVGSRTGERASVQLAERGSKRALTRITKGMMIAIPAVGAFFAIYLFKTDLERLREEWSTKIRTSSVFFVGAGMADLVDVFLHFFIVFGLLTHFSHHKLVVAEEWSMLCAITSTVCAVVGEIVSSRLRRRRDRSSSDPSTAG